MSKREDAQAVLSLAYKYYDLLSCIEGQRSGLLTDEIIRFNAQMIEVANEGIKTRLCELAGEIEYE